MKHIKAKNYKKLNSRNKKRSFLNTIIKEDTFIYKKNKLNKINKINKTNKKSFLIRFIYFLFIFSFIFILIFVSIFKYNIININYHNLKQNIILKKDFDEEIKEMKQYLDMAINGILINQNETFYKSDNPKISIVISMYNAEGFIKNALLSIQNQDFKDIEIVIIDDCSKDNSTLLVKELMKKDPRIVLYQNEENKGTLYTKTKGILYSKGKYVMVLDQDDVYLQKDAFSTLYSLSEKENLDILGFSALISSTTHFYRGQTILNYFETPVFYQPNISQQMYAFNYDNKPKRKGYFILNYIYKTNLFINTIKQIDDKIMNTRMNCHEDFLLFFLLTRNAYNMKNIKRIFYVHLDWKNINNPKIIFSINEKKKNAENASCLSYINYIELLLIKTKDNILDKRIASYELENWFLNKNCKYKKFIKKRAQYVCKLFLENEYIENDIKNKIKTLFPYI